MSETISKIDLAGIPSNLRQIIYQFRTETGLSRTDFEVLTTLFTLTQKGTMFRPPKDIAKKLFTLSRDYLYDSISKLKTLGYFEQLREPLRNSSGYYRSGLYGCTWKGRKLVREFVNEMELLGEKTMNGY